MNPPAPQTTTLVFFSFIYQAPKCVLRQTILELFYAWRSNG